MLVIMCNNVDSQCQLNLLLDDLEAAPVIPLDDFEYAESWKLYQMAYII
jgi:hypothetical protein